MNEIDPRKEWRLQQETDMLYMPFVESAGDTLLKFLQERSNKEIFEKKGGKLTVSIPTDGSPNARATTPLNKPFEPTIEIRLSMLLEIYKDALAFPLISGLIQKEHQVLKQLNEEQFKGASFTFSDAVPEIAEHLITGPLTTHCTAMANYAVEHGDERIGKNDVYCRFLMFEIMMAWTFFHELSHILQQHHAVRAHLGKPDAPSDHIDEMVGGNPSDASLLGQAREILADAEGVHLTLAYLTRGKRLNYATTYLLLCAVSCMFQRFYNHHEASLEVTSGQHPHPVIRDEFAHAAAMNWVTSYLLKTKTVSTHAEAAFSLAYYSTRASLFTGLYRANRIEKFDGTKLPSFMALASEEHHAQKRIYMGKLGMHIKEQAAIINELHLNPTGALELLLTCVRNIDSR